MAIALGRRIGCIERNESEEYAMKITVMGNQKPRIAFALMLWGMALQRIDPAYGAVAGNLGRRTFPTVSAGG